MTGDEQREALTEALWLEFTRSTPERFWDAAFWGDGGWLPGSLDVADRKRIVLGVLTSDALARLLADAEQRGAARATAATGTGSFWTQAEWAEWSNDLAGLIPEDDVSRYANPEGAQESIIEGCLRAYVAERRPAAEVRAEVLRDYAGIVETYETGEQAAAAMRVMADIAVRSARAEEDERG